LEITSKMLRVAILGTGNIGTDLLFKVRRSEVLKCSFFVGRRADSPGLKKAKSMGISALPGGIQELKAHLESVDIVFDATSAADHLKHADMLLQEGCHVINLTPAPLGDYYVPGVTKISSSAPGTSRNLNMVTCGGQTTIPFISRLANAFQEITSVEIASTLSSSSAGPATRRNLDEYIQNTERAIKSLTGVSSAKAMLVLNPAKPEIMMHTSVYISGTGLNINVAGQETSDVLESMRTHVPGISVTSDPKMLSSDVLHFSIGVEGAGDYLPKHAGNLDIINVAAIRAAEELA
jgi:acetaldehyde dehydrogenase